MQPRHVVAYPDSNICREVEVPSNRIGLVLINRRSPVNRNAAQNEAQKDRHIQPVTPADQEMMPPGHEHAGLFRWHTRGDRFRTWSCGPAHSRHLLSIATGCGRDLKDLVRG